MTRSRRDLARAQNALRRLLDGYQEQLVTLEELRARTPELRKREATLQAQLDALDAELHDAETYLKLTETLDGFRARLSSNAENLTVEQRQQIIRLVVREVLIGEDDVTIRHSIPTPTRDQPPGYLLRLGSREDPDPGAGPHRSRSLPMQARARPGATTHDYKRNGTTSLYAALDIITGEVIGQLHCPPPRDRVQEVPADDRPRRTRRARRARRARQQLDPQDAGDPALADRSPTLRRCTSPRPELLAEPRRAVVRRTDHQKAQTRHSPLRR